MMLDRKSTTSEFLHSMFQRSHLDLVPEIELSSNDLLIDLARIGLGIAFVPDFCIPADESQLYILKLAQSLPARSWWWPQRLGPLYPRRPNNSWICCKMALGLPSIPEILQAPGPHFPRFTTWKRSHSLGNSSR